jgi:hypothetical protein
VGSRGDPLPLGGSGLRRSSVGSNRFLDKRDSERDIPSFGHANRYPLGRGTAGPDSFIETGLGSATVNDSLREPNVHPFIPVKVSDLLLPNEVGVSASLAGFVPGESRNLQEPPLKLLPC